MIFPWKGEVKAQPAEATDDPVLLRALAERLIGVHFSPEHELLVGTLPDALPVENLPIPDGASILGSVVRGDDYMEVVLTSTQLPDEIVNFYEEQLLNAGWRVGEPQIQLLEFSRSDADQSAMNLPPIYCSDTENIALQVSVELQPEQPTDIRLSIFGAEISGLSSGCQSNGLAFLPNLQLPSGVEISTSHAGSDGDKALYTDIVVNTSLTGEALLSHLSEQFEQAGWTPMEQMNDDILSWASWTFEGEPGETWQGVLNIIKLQGVTDEYLLRAQVARVSNVGALQHVNEYL
ncbi:MAG: hypothetical protein AAF921_21450 [Cyanobacteria bacterium P01_D01_bin.44]